MKENNQPILSICIPTWNRWYSLQHTLKSIIDQEEFKSWDVEVVISDNASTDETEEKVKNLCKMYKNVVYYRNMKNLWFWPNIINALNLWNGKYLWLLWSDDRICDSSIKSLIKCTNENPSLILWNFLTNQYDDISSWWDLILNKYKNVADFLNNELWQEFLKDKHINYFDVYEGYLSFMSIYCFSKKFFNEVIKNSDIDTIKYHSFNFSYLWLTVIEPEILFIRLPILCRQWHGEKRTYETKWKMDSKIVFDKCSQLRKIFKKRNLSLKSKIYMVKCALFWIKAYIMTLLIIGFKKIWIYNVLCKCYKKYFK